MASRALLDLLDQAPSGSTLIISAVGQVLRVFLWRLFRPVELRMCPKFSGEHPEQTIPTKDSPNLLKEITAAVQIFRTAGKQGKMSARFRVNLNPLRGSRAAEAAPPRPAAPEGSGQADQMSSQRGGDAGTGHPEACSSPDSRAATTATPPSISGRPPTGATGQVELRYVLRSRVDEYVNVSDRFPIWLAITLGFAGGDSAALVALAAGAQHRLHASP
jgi:hypothetical protein